MNIKKSLVSIILILMPILLAIGVFNYKKYINTAGEKYYVQLVNEPISCKKEKNDVTLCRYKEKGYNDECTEKILEFYSNRERPLKKDAYLVLTYSSIKEDVVRYKEVKKEEIPKKVLEKLEKNKSLK